MNPQNRYPRIDDIHPVTLAAMLLDYDMLEYYFKRIHPSFLSQHIAKSGKYSCFEMGHHRKGLSVRRVDMFGRS